MNGPNTHSAFIHIPGVGNAFIDGVPDTCEHDYKDWVHFTESGKEIYWHTFKQWASYTSEMRDRLIVEHQEKIGDSIQGGASCCRKCEKVYQTDIWAV